MSKQKTPAYLSAFVTQQQRDKIKAQIEAKSEAAEGGCLLTCYKVGKRSNLPCVNVDNGNGGRVLVPVRMAYWLACGNPKPRHHIRKEQMQLAPFCENPDCLQHLRVTTHGAEMRRHAKAGRIGTVSAAARAKISAAMRKQTGITDAAIEAARLAGKTAREMAEEFGVTLCHAQKLARYAKRKPLASTSPWAGLM